MIRNETPQLYTVLPERRTGPVGAAMMASTHIYDMSAVSEMKKEKKGNLIPCIESVGQCLVCLQCCGASFIKDTGLKSPHHGTLNFLQ